MCIVYTLINITTTINYCQTENLLIARTDMINVN